MRNGMLMRVSIIVMGLSLGTIARHYYPPAPAKLSAEDLQKMEALMRRHDASEVPAVGGYLGVPGLMPPQESGTKK